MKRISQRQAQYYRKENLALMKTLADQKNRWKAEWTSGWVNIDSFTVPEASYARIATARLLGHAVIVTPDSNGSIRFYADRLERTP